MAKVPTITRADLAEAVYREVGFSRKASGEMVDQMLEEISNVILQTGGLKLSGFGNFTVRHKRPRVGRNPKTGQEVPITSRKVMVFRASHILKARVNGETPVEGKE